MGWAGLAVEFFENVARPQPVCLAEAPAFQRLAVGTEFDQAGPLASNLRAFHTIVVTIYPTKLQISDYNQINPVGKLVMFMAPFGQGHPDSKAIFLGAGSYPLLQSHCLRFRSSNSKAEK